MAGCRGGIRGAVLDARRRAGPAPRGCTPQGQGQEGSAHPPERLRPASARRKKLPAVTTRSPGLRSASTWIESPRAGPRDRTAPCLLVLLPAGAEPPWLTPFGLLVTTGPDDPEGLP